MSGWHPDEWQDVIARHAPALVMYAAQWSLDPEDVVQETFVELFREAVPPDSVAGWLFAVVRNKSVSSLRAAARRRNHERGRAGLSREWFVESPGDSLDADEAARWVDELAGELREIVIARVWGELTFEQIAELTGSSQSTCHRRYREALDILRKRSGVSCPNTNS